MSPLDGSWVLCAEGLLASGLQGREFFEKEMVVVRENDGATSRECGLKARCSGCVLVLNLGQPPPRKVPGVH